MHNKILTYTLGIVGMVWNVFARTFFPVFYFPLTCVSEWKQFRIFLGITRHYDGFREACEDKCDEECNLEKCICFELATNTARNEVLNPSF